MNAAVVRQQVFRPTVTEIISFFPAPDEKPANVTYEDKTDYQTSEMPSKAENSAAASLNVHANVFKDMIALAQLHQKYILAQGESGLYVLDQHAAMERIRYEHFQKQLLHGDQSMQPLLIPVIIEGRKKFLSYLSQEGVKVEDVKQDISLEVLPEEEIKIKEIELIKICQIFI
jgi:DNA mismatch repair protein MutL